MSNNFLFVNTEGDYEQSPGAYEQSDFINNSVGVADAGKPVILDSTGKFDPSFYDLSDISHSSISNLSADDHTQYSLVAGTRDYTGIISYSSHPSFVSDEDLVDKKYVDDLVSSSGTASEWQDSCLDGSILDPSGLTPSTGDRYLINGAGSGTWSGKDDNIAEWDGSSWQYAVVSTGTYVSVDDENDGLYFFGGSSWVKKFYESTTASLGCAKVGVDIRVDLLANGGLKLTGNEIGVEPNDFVGAGLIDDGSDNMAIDWSASFSDSKAIKANDLNSVTNGEGASIIGIEDVGNYTTETSVEGALQEIFEKVNEFGNTFTAGQNITKGDLLYISANDAVSTMPINSSHSGIGIAAATIATGNQIKVLGNDTICKGVLSGATAGQKYYWNGTTLTSTKPTGSGNYIWKSGVAVNGNDMQVEVNFVVKNA